MSKFKFALAVFLIALAAAPVFAQDRLTPVRIHTVLAVVSAPPASPVIGDQYLIGYEPKSPWGGQEDKLARWTGSKWQTKAVDVPDFVYDASGAELYAKTDSFGVGAGHLWPGSKFVRLSDGFPKFRPTGIALGDVYVDTSYHGASIASSPNDPATITLRSPGNNGDTIGILVRVEKFAGTQSSLTIVADHDGVICDQNLSVISPIVIPNTIGKQLILRAGDPASACAWYAEGYAP